LTADLACRSYSADILGGLHELHSAGVMVLDLKPSNVLLDGDGGQVRAVLSDFGLARLLQQRHAPGELRAPTISLSGCGALVSAIGSPPSAFHISLKIFSKTQKKSLTRNVKITTKKFSFSVSMIKPSSAPSAF
jgi:serine/threonine protein kinase